MTDTRKHTVKSTLTRVFCGIVFFVIWDFTVRFFQVPDYILPRPQRVAEALMQDQRLLWQHFQETLRVWIAGLSTSILLGLFISISAFQSPSLAKNVDRFLIVSQSVPYLTIAPLLLLWLGLGAAPKIVLVLLTCTFPIAQLTLTGLQSARNEYSILATLLRFRGSRALTRIYAPAALPEFLEGVKISVTYAFVSTVLAELIGSEAGLGVYLSRAQSAYRTDRVLAVVFIIVIYSLFCTWCVNAFSRRLLFWKVKKNV